MTDFNVEEMRQLVINGAHKHPGANFVEDEKGRKTPLAKLSLQTQSACQDTADTIKYGKQEIQNVFGDTCVTVTSC